MQAISVRNPFAEPFTLPPPLTGVLSQGQTIILPYTQEQFYALAKNLTQLQATQLPASYPGPIDWSFISAPNAALAVLQTDWYVDWVGGRDDWPGTQQQPVKTVMGGVVPKWGGPSPELPQSVTLHFVSSQPQGAEKIIISPRMLNGSMLALIGSKTLVATIALGAVTAKNRAGKQLLQAAGFTGRSAGQLAVNTASGKASHALVASVAGDVATLMQPLVTLKRGVDVAYFPLPAEVDTWAAGDAVQIYDLTAINLVDVSLEGPQSDLGPVNGAVLWIEGIKQLDPSGVPGESTFCPEYEGGYMLYQDCWFQGFLTTTQTTFMTTFVNCWNQYGFQYSYANFLGGMISNFGAQFDGVNWMDADVIIDAVSAITSGILFTGYVGMTASGGIILHPASSMEIRNLGYGNGFMYGAGSLSLQAQSAVVRRSPTPSWVGCLALGSLVLPSSATVGTSYAAGVFTDGHALTPANLDTYHGLMDVRTGAKFCEDL